MDGRNPDMFEPYIICPICQKSILDNRSRVINWHDGEHIYQTVHRKCRDTVREVAR